MEIVRPINDILAEQMSLTRNQRDDELIEKLNNALLEQNLSGGKIVFLADSDGNVVQRQAIMFDFEDEDPLAMLKYYLRHIDDSMP